MRKFLLTIFILFPLFSAPSPVSAHAFGATYTLPIPFWLYLYAGALALFLSFLLIGFFSTKKDAIEQYPMYSLSKIGLINFLSSPQMQMIFKSVSVFLFCLMIITGLFGDDLSAFNFNMTFFWVICVLGITYVTFFIGNIWEILNPWKILIELYERLTRSSVTGVVLYSKKFGYYPAFILYLLFIAIELFVGTTPFTLSVILLQYTFFTFFAIFLVGKTAWFTYGEFFTVFFRFISYASPVAVVKRKIFLRPPFLGLLSEKAGSQSVLFFILFMLSSTAFDGMRETNLWFSLYWDVFQKYLGLFFPATSGYAVFEFLGLLLSPLLFWLLYMVCMQLMKNLTSIKKSVRELSLIFAFTLVPIAIAYNVAHYFTLLVLQGQVIVRLISDPFGWRWNVFGTAGFIPAISVLPASFVWHFQVAVILLGHIIAVYLAHIVSLKLFASQKQALVSQLPMLILMIVYTMIGLWILSQPIGLR